MDYNDVIFMINENKISEAIELINDLCERKEKKIIPVLINILENTENHMLRNNVAIALADIGANEAVDSMFTMLQDPKTLGFRGTLLYALENLDYTSHINVLVEILCEGNFEVSRHSLLLIKEKKDLMTNDEKMKYLQVIKNKASELEERLDFLLEAINEISE